MRFYKLIKGGWYGIAIVCGSAFGVAQASAAEIEPYEARVVVARAQIRSGPGDDFYPTEALVLGEIVEVYREQGDGWLAIRPPKNSFSWIFGRHLTLRDNGLAEINKEDVASRIGSGFSDRRNAVQVRLQKGEVVEIVGEETIDGESWYKISPPAGEFRWIHATHVKRLGSIRAFDDARQENETVVVTSATDESEPGAGDENKSRSKEAAAPLSNTQPSPVDDWRAAGSGVKLPQAGPVAPPLAAPPSAPAAELPIQPVPVATNAQAPMPPVEQSTESLSRKLTEIEVRLSRMVAAPPGQWNTERLERDTEDLLAEAQTDDERDSLKAMLAKLDRFEAIGKRHQQPAPLSPQPSTAGQAPDGGGQAAPDGSNYDAVGILRPVVSKRPGAPQFALVNERGQVISFVTPTPDVNLQPYVGHRVGVVGTRGFIPEFQRAHVTAGRVAPLSERLVR